MRTARIPLALVLLMGAAALHPSPGEATGRSFRLVVADMRQDLSDTLTYSSYAAHLADRVATASTAFATDGRETLLVLPEDAGLMAWLVGARGEAGRLAGTLTRNSAAGIAALAVPYAPAIAYYATKCGDIPPARMLTLALTDTAWRAFAEPLAGLAAQEGIWIMANANVAEAAVTTDPARVALLGDPTAPRPFAYEGGCDVHNAALLFAPDGSLHARRNKAYLVPIERARDVGLAMTGERMADVRPIDTPFGRLGVLTSKDAWMPDVSERLDDEGMEVFIQPEAGAWAGHGEAPLPDWPPDAMQRPIWAQVQRLPETRYGALPNLTGNFFDLYFDGTATITKDADPSDAPAYLLGRLPGPGIAARAPWLAPDPPAGIDIADWAARRAALDAAGARLAPGSGDQMENGQLEEVVWTDVTLPEVPAQSPRVARPASLGAAIRLASTIEPQWAPSVSARPGGAVVGFTDLRFGNERPAAVRVTAGVPGAVRFAGSDPSPVDQTGNGYDMRAVSLPDGRTQIVWTDFRNQSWSIYGTHTTSAGMFEEPLLLDHSPTSSASTAENFPTEQIHQDPQVAIAPDGTLYATWADVRGRRVPWRIAVSRSEDGGHTWSVERRADGGGALETAQAELDAVDPTAPADQFAPAIAVGPDGAVWVAWQDHATARPRVLVARSSDGGRTFFPAVAPGAGSAAAQFRPSIAIAADGTAAVAWEAEHAGGRVVRTARAPAGGAFGAAQQVDPGAPAGSRQARAQVAALASGFAIVWQDDRAGDWDVLGAQSAGAAGAFGAPVRYDDGPAGSHARLPSIAAAGSGVAVAWEDTRHGPEQIYYLQP